MKLYENVVIGNFLYSLGFSICSKSKDTVNPVSVNLLQQTPIDKPLGDALIRGPGTLRLIEFKQTTNKSKKEFYKQKILCDAISGNFELLELSRSVHWFLETGIKAELNMMVTRAVPYIEAFSTKETMHDFEGFIQSTASEIVRPKPVFSEEILKAYLRLIANINGKDTAGAGGFVLYANKDGAMRFCELQDIMQLKLLDRDYQNQIVMQYENRNLIEKEKTHSKQRSRTIENDMEY